MCAFAICNRNKKKEVRERESAREKHVVDRTNFQFFFLLHTVYMWLNVFYVHVFRRGIVESRDSKTVRWNCDCCTRGTVIVLRGLARDVKTGEIGSAAIHVCSRCRIWIHSLAHKYESDSFLIVLYVSAVLWMFDYSMWWHLRCCSGHYEFSLAECLSDIGRICYRYYRETTIWYICDLRLWPYGTTANILSRLIILDLFLSAYEHNTNKYQGMHHRYCKSSQRTIQWTKFMYRILVRWW